jgi:hypothetical protein
MSTIKLKKTALNHISVLAVSKTEGYNMERSRSEIYNGTINRLLLLNALMHLDGLYPLWLSSLARSTNLNGIKISTLTG